jgi:YYY domain-containing protein
MIGYGDQVLYVLSWLAILKLLQLSVWPILRPLFGRLAYPTAYTVSLILLLLGSFYLGLLHLPTWLVIAPFLVLLGAGLAKGHYGRTAWEGVTKWDAVFLLFFLFVLELRFFNPYVSHYSEQFMDLAWVAAIMRNPVVTPLDPWFVGGTLDVYYYLGHWLMAQLGLLAGVPARVVFNLVLPTVMAVSAVNCYLIGHVLLDRFRWLPIGLLVLVNPTAIVQLASGKALIPALDHSRHAIQNGLTEYPLFSMILGDPHALVMGMINQLFLIALLAFAWVRWSGLSSRQRWMLMGLSALSLGAMPGINSWDVLVYAPFVVVMGLLLWWRARSNGETGARQALLYSIVVPALGLGLYLPYLLAIQPGSVHGVLPVISPSEPISFLLTWGFFFAVVAVAIARQLPRQPFPLLIAVPFIYLGYYSAGIAAVLLVYSVLRGRRTGRFEDLAVIVGLALILFVEVLYFREIFDNEYFRTNTMHKLYYIAWLMLGIGCTGLIGRWLAGRQRPLLAAPAARVGLAVVAIAALLAFPVVFQPDVGHGLLGIDFGGGDQTLDGLAYLDSAHPADAEAIRFLETYSGAGGIVEAAGDDYSYGAPISSFTGIPTIIGKRSHELQWRTNNDGWWWSRIPDVERCYEEPDQTVALMQKYGCELLYVGDIERQKYTVNLPSRGLEMYYNRNGVQIYRLSATP